MFSMKMIEASILCNSARLNVSLYCSVNDGITSTITVDSTHPLTEVGSNSNASDALKNMAKADNTDVNNNEMQNISANNQNNNLDKGSLKSQNSRGENGLSVDTDIVVEENIIHDEKGDKNSAVCDVEDYVFGGADELVDARSDFRTDRHSPHSKNGDPKQEFHFDHTGRADSSHKGENGESHSVVDDLPGDCGVRSSQKHKNGDSELVVVDPVGDHINLNSVDKTQLVTRCDSDRSLESFFTQVTHMSQEKLDLESLNCQLEPGDTYSLVSGSEYSIAVESIVSRARLDELEIRELEALSIQSSGNNSLSSNGSSPNKWNDWKQTIWNKSSEPSIFLPQEHR